MEKQRSTHKHESLDSDDNPGGCEDGDEGEPKTIYHVADLELGSHRYALNLYELHVGGQYRYCKASFISYTIAS